MASKISRPINPLAAPATPKKRKPRMDLLTPEDMQRITEEARAKIEAEAKFEAEEAFLAQEKERLRRETNPLPEEQTRPFTIDLPVSADRIVLDGRAYMHGHTYDVTKAVADVLNEQVQNLVRHEREVTSGNDYRNTFRKARNLVLSARDL